MPKNLQFARSDAQLGDAQLVGLERAAGRRGWPGGGLFAGQRQTKPNPQGRENRGHQTAIDLKRMLDHQKPIFRELQKGYERPAAQTIQQNVWPWPEASTAFACCRAIHAGHDTRRVWPTCAAGNRGV